MTYSVQDPWTQRKRAEFEWATGPHVAAAGVGQVPSGGRRAIVIPQISRGIVIPQISVGRQIALPKSQWGGGRFGLRDIEPPPPRPMNWVAILGWGAVLAAAAGIFWATTNQPRRVTSNRRRRARRRVRRNGTRYELVYSTGGHGGPYQSLDAAKDEAERRLRGGRDQWIAVVPAAQINNLRAARPTAVLYRKGGWQDRSWLPNIPAHLRENRRRRRSSRRRVSRNNDRKPGPYRLVNVADPQEAKLTAEGMLELFGSVAEARSAAWSHAMDAAPRSPTRLYWMRVRAMIGKLRENRRRSSRGRRRRAGRAAANMRGKRRRVRSNAREWWEDRSGESTVSAKAKKPMKVGLGYILGSNGEPKMFTRAGAQRYVDQYAKQRDRNERRKYPFWNGFISDMGDYWRGNIGGHPFPSRSSSR